MIETESTSAKNDKRPGCIYWSQADYKSLAWCCPEKGKCNFKMHWEKCFYRRGQLLKPFYRIPCVEDSSSETCHLMPIIHIKKKIHEMNSYQRTCGNKFQRWLEKQIAYVIKGVMRRKLSCLAQQNKGNIAWLFFRNTRLDNIKEGKESRRKYWHKGRSL